MKSPFFKKLFEQDYDFPKDVVVLDFFKGWLLKHDKVLFNFFNNALKANKAFIKKDLVKWPIENQYYFLNSEILDLGTFIKKNPIHCKILFEKIGEVDELYDANEILNLISLIHYPFLEVYFNALDLIRNKLKEEHFQNAETALETINITMKLINEFKASDTKINLDFHYQGSKNLTGLASYLVFVGYSIQIYYRFKSVKEELIKKHPNLVLTHKQKSKKKLDLKKNIIDKLPSDWKSRTLSEYFYFIFRKNHPRECKTFEIETTIERREIQQKIKNMNYVEKTEFLDKEMNSISKILDSPEIQQSVSLFTISMEEHFINLQSKVELAQLITESDGYFYSDEEVSRNKDLIKMAEFMQDLPLPDPSTQLIQDSKENLNYLDKWMTNPMVSNFLKVKSLLDKKEFLKGLLVHLNLEENDEELPKKDKSNDSNIRWYNSDAPFDLPEGYRKIELDMTPQEERKFFSFLCLETNGSSKTFLSIEDGKEIFEYGFTIPNVSSKNFYKLGLKGNRRSKKIIYICFYELFTKMKKFIKQEVKEELASFLKYYFYEFKDMDVKVIKERMRWYENQDYMKMKLEKYLPK